MRNQRNSICLSYLIAGCIYLPRPSLGRRATSGTLTATVVYESKRRSNYVTIQDTYSLLAKLRARTVSALSDSKRRRTQTKRAVPLTNISRATHFSSRLPRRAVGCAVGICGFLRFFHAFVCQVAIGRSTR